MQIGADRLEMADETQSAITLLSHFYAQLNGASKR